jgi:hypothetical protein
MKLGHLKYLLLIPLIALLACKSRKTPNTAQVKQDVIESTEDVQTNTEASLEIENPADTVWINALEKTSVVNFKYDQPVNGYEVTGRWLPYEYMLGSLVINFQNATNGQSFCYIFNDHLNDYHVRFSKELKEYRENVFSISKYQDDSYPISYYAPFQFFDVDFDGKDELLINDYGLYKGGNHHYVYKIKADAIHLMDYPPFKHICTHSTEFNKADRQIVLYLEDGWACIYKCFFSKQSAIIEGGIPQQLTKTWSLFDDYFKQKKTDFRLDSVQAHICDTLFTYKTMRNRLTLTEKRLDKR